VRRYFIFLAGILLVLFAANGCRRVSPPITAGKLNVVSVIFPSYDFVRAIAGDKVNLVMLLAPGAESHSYEPSPRDIITIEKSDLFIYTGGENSKWVDRILESVNTPGSKMKALKLMDLVQTVKEETVEGMENDNDEAESGPVDGTSTDRSEAEGGSPLDEHVWTTPGNAKSIVAGIGKVLCDLDPANAEFYRKNMADYTARLDELDATFRSIVEGAKRKTIVFGDRFPFRYFADAYGLKYFAAFPGCSSETEPSAATVAFLINKIKSENIPVVFHIELSNEKMADAISEATGAKKLLFHSCHNVTRNDFENGANYLDLQKVNADHLKEALW